METFSVTQKTGAELVRHASAIKLSSAVLNHYLQLLQPGLRALSSLVFPRACYGCGDAVAQNTTDEAMEAWLCRSCLSGMESIEPPFCRICGEAFDGAAEGLIRCTNCADRRLHFEFAIAAFKAEGVMRTLVHKFKYNKDITLRAVLVAALHRVLLDVRLETLNLAEWTLVPVPLHRSRLHERGFNQSWELCRLLGRRLKVPVRQALKRSRPTHRQADLTRAQRLENLSGAFRMSGWTRGQRRALEGKNVVLVDDVFTTGATTDACARVLRREGGVARVIVISVARG